MSNLVQINKIVEQATVLEADDKVILFEKIQNFMPTNKERLKARLHGLRGLYSDSPIPDKKELSRIFYENSIS
jgi:hypothetical protein